MSHASSIARRITHARPLTTPGAPGLVTGNSPRGFTLLDLLTTVAALVILLGLMVSLAQYVRTRSAATLSKRLMARVDDLMTQYVRRYGDVPDLPPLIVDPQAELNEANLQQHALANNRALVAILGREAGWDQLPIAVYPDATLRDAWGTPIVFMAPSAANIRTPPQNRRFFLSAGPDRRFLTRDDNLYSYELAGGER